MVDYKIAAENFRGVTSATKAIRSSSHPNVKSIPVFAMTANAFREDVEQAIAAGMNGHLAKPIEIDRLYQLMRGI